MSDVFNVGVDPLSYSGIGAAKPPILAQRAPTALDIGYDIGQTWIDVPAGAAYTLTSVVASVATWNLQGAGGTGALLSITGDAGGAEVPDGGGNFSILGTAAQITTTGTANTLTLSIPVVFTAPGSIASTTTVAVGTDLTVGGTVIVTGLTTLGAFTQAGTASINATGAATTTIGSATAGAISMDTTAGITLNADSASSFTVTDAGVDLTLASTLGSVNITAGQSAADSIVISSAIGGIDIIAAGAAAGEDIDITATGSSINLVSTEAAVTNAIRLNASAADGGIDIDAGTGGITVDSTGAISIDGAAASNVTVTGAGIDLTLASVGGSVAVTSTEDAASAISLTANGGVTETIVVTASQGTGAASIALTSTAGGVTLTGGLATGDAINIVTSNAGGGIDIDAGTAGVIVDTTGAFSIDGAAASNVTVTGAGIDLTLSSVLGSVLVSSTEDAALAIRLHANGGTSETIQVHADQGTGVGSINLLSDVGGITLTGGLATADAINIVASNAGGGIDIDAGTAGIAVNAANGPITIASGTGTVAISADATANTVNLGTGAGVKTLTLGSTNTTSATTINAGSGGVHVVAAGLVNIDTATDTQASPTATSTLNVRAGAVTFTGFTTAAAGTQDFTITNSLVTTSSNILCSVCNEGANDAQMNIRRITRAAGSFVVKVVNDGAAALNGNIIVTFWVLDN